jgi:hypothetical protein
MVVRPIKGVPGWWLVRATGEAGQSLEVAAALRIQPGVLSAEPQLARIREDLAGLPDQEEPRPDPVYRVLRLSPRG